MEKNEEYIQERYAKSRIVVPPPTPHLSPWLKGQDMKISSIGTVKPKCVSFLFLEIKIIGFLKLLRLNTSIGSSFIK